MKARLIKAVETVAKRLEEHNFEDTYQYALFLSQAYYFVKHSTPMLALSAALSIDNRAYHIRCIEHLGEEKGHDKMLLNDLKFMGYKLEDFPEFSMTKALYQTQYYWIEHKSARSFLGYIVLLEGLAVYSGKKILKRVEKFKGKSFIDNHSKDDVEHLEKAFKEIDSLPQGEQELAVENCELAAQIYIAMLAEMNTASTFIRKVS